MHAVWGGGPAPLGHAVTLIGAGAGWVGRDGSRYRRVGTRGQSSRRCLHSSLGNHGGGYDDKTHIQAQETQTYIDTCT